MIMEDTEAIYAGSQIKWCGFKHVIRWTKSWNLAFQFVVCAPQTHKTPADCHTIGFILLLFRICYLLSFVFTPSVPSSLNTRQTLIFYCSPVVMHENKLNRTRWHAQIIKPKDGLMTEASDNSQQLLLEAKQHAINAVTLRSCITTDGGRAKLI